MVNIFSAPIDSFDASMEAKAEAETDGDNEVE